MKLMQLLLGLLVTLPASWVWCQTHTGLTTGEVRVPLPRYTEMLEQVRDQPRPAQAAYAIGEADVNVIVTAGEEKTSARVTVTALIETFENEWTLVPVLPVGVALSAVLVDDKPTPLVQGPDGLSWSTNKASTVALTLVYGLDAHRSENGYVLPLPLPRAAATQVTLQLPGTGLDLAIVPAADVQTVEKGDITRASASVPATASVLVSWRIPSKRSHAVSRAAYQGELQGEALVWSAVYEVEVFSGELITLPLLPVGVTLSDVRIDNLPATVLIEDQWFATTLQGRGLHQVQVQFQTPVSEADGPPSVQLHIPQIPVSRFALTLPGNKELSVAPHANVVSRRQDDTTEATVFMPMSEHVSFSWVEAIPDDMRAEVRANANLYHLVHAEAGVLLIQGLVAYDITHGETKQLALDVAAAAEINQISSPTAPVADWSVAQADDNGRKQIKIFLERPVNGEVLLDLEYEQLLGTGAGAAEPVAAPLLRALNVNRQRGMVALLAGPELDLNPRQTAGVSGVGENQLPAFVRNRLQLAVAHTYRYIDPLPTLIVQAMAPERKQGIFDAQIDTLISLGEVSLRGAASVEVNVKSGSLLELALDLPINLNILSVSGPSLRNHAIELIDNGQRINLEFTQEMEGQFRLEVIYERITTDAAAEVSVPTLSVNSAEVEHGRIAVEALTAVEVKAATADQLSAVDINELPQQLVLKTTNPILLAYKYVRAETPFRLALAVTRHREIEVQVAAIETADYRTLYTRDGLAVTAVRLDVRNSRRQFLRLTLPPDSEIWSVFIDGQAEKPARAEDGEAVLIKMINSANGFPVELVYATRAKPMASFGSVTGRLPRPDMVVTRTRWEVLLPAGFYYMKPQSTLDILGYNDRVSSRQFNTERLAQSAGRRLPTGQPLRLTIPVQGIQFRFEKLYANQAPEAARFVIGYSDNTIALALGLLAILALALWYAVRRRRLGKAVPATKYQAL